MFAFASTFLVTIVVSYFLGTYQTEKQWQSVLERSAEDQLASYLFMLEQIEKDNLNEVKVILQAGTNGQLESIIDYADFNDVDHAKFRCILLKKLKAYRDEKNLFKTADWDYLWQVSGMREAENKRIEFLQNRLPQICSAGKPK